MSTEHYGSLNELMISGKASHEAGTRSKSSRLQYKASKTKSLESKHGRTTPEKSCSSSHFGDKADCLAIAGQEARQWSDFPDILVS